MEAFASALDPSSCHEPPQQFSHPIRSDAGLADEVSHRGVPSEPTKYLEDLSLDPVVNWCLRRIRPTREEVREYLPADEPDHALAVDTEFQQRPCLHHLAVAPEETEPAQLGDEALDVGAGPERVPELAEERLQPHLGREAPRSGRLLAGQERGLPGHLARVGRRALLEYEPGPEDDEEGAGVGAKTKIRGRIERRVRGDLAGEPTPTCSE